jgi:hypothetical protein
MIEIITAAGFALAWIAFRYERHRRWRDDLDAAYGILSAVHYGMVTGLTPGQAVGWGQIYFSTTYTEEVAKQRARNTRDLVNMRGIDQVLVVPTEPLALLATTSPQPGLVESETVATANFALWRVHAFNQLVRQMTDFNSQHAVEITSADTDLQRREEIAAAAMSLSLFVHLDGIGQAWARFPDGSVGWYRALVEAVAKNLGDLYVLRGTVRWHWLHEWQYTVIDVLVTLGVLTVLIVSSS